MYKICDITWGGMAAAASAPAASGDDFSNSFPMDSRGLLNSELSRAIEEKTNAEIHEEIAENAAEAGRLPGGDGDGNALYVNDSGKGVFVSTRSHRKRS